MWAEKGGEILNLPPFEDFLATLDPDTISGIMGDANQAAKSVNRVSLADQSDKVPLQVLSISYQTALELLAVYHKWLEQNL